MASGLSQTQTAGEHGIKALFAVVYATSVSSVYFALGVIAGHAQGLTPEVFIGAGIFFQITVMTYTEGVSLYPRGGGSAVFARYAFNELVSFISGWSIVLDYTILVAVTALTVPAYLAVFWPALGHGAGELAVSLLVIVLVSADTMRGFSARRLRRRILLAVTDFGVQAALIVFGLILVFHPDHLTQAVHLGSKPSVADLGFALPVAVVAFAGLESAAGIAPEVAADPGSLKRMVSVASLAVMLVYVGIAVVGIAALPVHHGVTALGQVHRNAPMLAVAEALHPKGFADAFKYLVSVTGVLVLLAACSAAMVGVSRVGYSMATNRQIPSAIGRLSERWSTPWLVIALAAIAAAALVIPKNLETLVGIYAFGALLSFTIAHVSVVALRYSEPDRPRGYRIPLSVSFRGGELPLPAVLGALLSAIGWIALIVYHHGARYVGLGWLLSGVVLYVLYRTTQGKPLLRRITIPERALRHEASEAEFGSILVPIFGTPLDDDIIQTAGRLAGETRDELTEEGATIEAIWVFEMPISLPLDAPLPSARTEIARSALKRAKEIGEEYEGVEVATAMVRGRRAGHTIVQEAKRRGVEVIVLAAEPPSGIRGGALMGGSGPLENFVGEVTKYVVSKAPCRVILTAPPADWRERLPPRGGDAQQQPKLAGSNPGEQPERQDG